MRIWDCFLYEGARMIIFVCYTILKSNEKGIIACKNTHQLMTLFDDATSKIFNVDELLEETFKNFSLLSETELLER